MSITTNLIPIESISEKIFLIRGQKVMLDFHLAQLYEVTTTALNQQVKRNLRRFPVDFIFRLTSEEMRALNLSHIVIGSQKHRDPRFAPYAFTEHGVAMLSSVLKSDKAIEVNIRIVRAFIKVREVLASNKELAYKVEELERDQRNHARHINKIYAILGKLMSEPEKPKGPIGFATTATKTPPGKSPGGGRT